MSMIHSQRIVKDTLHDMSAFAHVLQIQFELVSLHAIFQSTRSKILSFSILEANL